MTKKRICIVGAGASGLPAIKECLEYGMEPVCFEKTGDIGGLWNFKSDSSLSGESSVMRSTVINTHKELSTYSDFPPPKEFANFMHNSQLLRYFRMYADHFGLLKHIRFNTQILQIQKGPEYQKDGRWTVKSRDNESGEEKTEVFDGVMVATGHHAAQNFPTFPGQEGFQGEVIHAQNYKEPTGYEGKRVAVVGIGNSGADIAVELSRTAEQVFLVTRRGSWVFGRQGPNGLPAYKSRLDEWVEAKMPSFIMDRKVHAALNTRFDHEKYGLKPKHKWNATHATVNDDLPVRIVTGTVKIKPNIKKFTKTGLVFEDGSREDNISSVIMCTGYEVGFPIFSSDIIPIEENKTTLYKYMYPPSLPHPTLAMIGCVQPVGVVSSTPPVSEMQSRVFCEVLTGNVKLPSEKEMMRDIEKKRQEMDARYVKSKRHTIQIDFTPFMDELGSMIGVKPNLLKYWLTDPILAHALSFDFAGNAQYRLQGPHPWSGARDAVLTLWERILYPLSGEQCLESVKERHSPLGMIKQLSMMVVIVGILLFLMTQISL